MDIKIGKRIKDKRTKEDVFKSLQKNGMSKAEFEKIYIDDSEFCYVSNAKYTNSLYDPISTVEVKHFARTQRGQTESIQWYSIKDFDARFAEC